MKRCARCAEIKSDDEFKIRHRAGRPDRLSSYCIICENGYHRSYYHESKPVYLYVMDYKSVDYCKIGVTQNLRDRLKDIRNVWPEAAYAAVYDARCAETIEQGLLKLFTTARVGKSEVLRIKADVVVLIVNNSQTHFECKIVPVEDYANL